MSVLVIAEHRDGLIRPVTRELVTAGAALGGGPLIVGVIGARASELGESVRLKGVDRVVTVPVDPAEFEADSWATAALALIDECRPEVVLLGHTVDSMSFAPGVAASRDLGFAADVVGLGRSEGVVSATRAYYGGRVHGVLTFPGRSAILLMIRPGEWSEAALAGTPDTGVLRVPADRASRTRHESYVGPMHSGVDIGSADFILSIGRGIGSQDAVAQFEELADRAGATLACSRPVVDAGWMSDSRQVGQSGTVVRPKVYLAFGISGAIQHLAGMKEATTVLAVNTDPDAAIFDVAQYGAVCDLFDVAERLAEVWS